MPVKTNKNGRSKASVVRRLVDGHMRIEPTISHVFRLLAPDGREENPDEPIKLLEVNSNTPEQGIFPIPMGADPSAQIWFKSVIVEVTPHELEQIRRGRLSLPHGWTLGEEFKRPSRRKVAG